MRFRICDNLACSEDALLKHIMHSAQCVRVCHSCSDLQGSELNRLTLICMLLLKKGAEVNAPGLVKLVPVVVAYHLCLNLPAAFMQPVA